MGFPEYQDDPGDRVLEYPIGSKVRFRDVRHPKSPSSFDGETGTVIAFCEGEGRIYYAVKLDRDHRGSIPMSGVHSEELELL